MIDQSFEPPLARISERMELMGLCRPARPIRTSAIMIGMPIKAMQTR